MESRLVVAYALIAVIVVGAAGFGIVFGRRRAQRRRRMRGIKTDEAARFQRRTIA